ncbi:MAG: hypothetical protein OEZ34_15640 [Spirochaetia bacterium]|nr:hypothetical protein [Spirochaetia bacterium]
MFESILTFSLKVYTIPSPGSSGVYLNQNLSIFFNDFMVSSSVNMQTSEGACTGTVQISKDNFSTCIGGTISSVDDRLFTVTPVYTLWDDSQYSIKVSTEVQSQSYTPILQNYISFFNTESMPYRTNLQLWYKANAITGYADGAPITTDWPDSGPNGWGAAPAFSPTFTASAIQGKPAVTFLRAGSNRFTVTAAANGFTNATSGISTFVVFNISNSADGFIQNSFDISVGTSIGPSRFNMLRSAGNQHRVEGREDDTDTLENVAAGAYTSNVFTIDTGILDYANNDIFLYNNGTLIASNTSLAWSTGYGTTSENTDSFGMTIGCGSSYGEFLDGQIAEIIVFNSVLSASARQSIECYLSRKYGIALTGVTCS